MRAADLASELLATAPIPKIEHLITRRAARSCRWAPCLSTTCKPVVVARHEISAKQQVDPKSQVICLVTLYWLTARRLLLQCIAFDCSGTQSLAIMASDAFRMESATQVSVFYKTITVQLVCIVQKVACMCAASACISSNDP